MENKPKCEVIGARFDLSCGQQPIVNKVVSYDPVTKNVYDGKKNHIGYGEIKDGILVITNLSHDTGE